MIRYKCSSSSKRWLNRHFNDQYVQEVQRRCCIRSRAWFKLNQIDSVDSLLDFGMTVVDLGSAPGGWSEYVKKKIGRYGHLISCDILPMDKMVGVDFIQGDFCDTNTLYALIDRTKSVKVDVILSDMCPNISGIANIDIPKLICLGELALELCNHVLVSGGSFLVKVFYGAGFDKYYSEVRSLFHSVKIRKPIASHVHSREVYIVAKEYKI